MSDRRWGVVGFGVVVGMLGASLVMAAESEGQGPIAKGPSEPSPAGVMTQPEPAAPPAAAAPTDAPRAEPTIDEVRSAITQYVKEMTEEEGAFYLEDEKTNDTRELTLTTVRDGVGKTGDLYYACTDMKDVDTNEALDVDFDVESYDNAWEVADVRIHKVGGKERYTYGENNTRVPVM